MRIDVMTDIETLGTNADSTIIQIAAIAFDIKTGEEIARFNKVADISKNERPLNVSGSTLQWWTNVNAELFKELLHSGEDSSEDVLLHFYAWLKGLSDDPRNLYLWGNGILFDNKMIQHQFESLGLTYPIFYRNDRDVRTIVELTSHKTGLSEKALRDRYYDENLVAHNAFDDCINQINMVVNCYKELMVSEVAV